MDDVGRLVSVAVDDPGLIAETVRRLDAVDIRIADLALHRPSLDDVFLRLTGHRSEAAGPRSDNGGAAHAEPRRRTA